MGESRTFIWAGLLWSDNATGYLLGFCFRSRVWCVGKWKQQGGYFLFFELDFANAQRFVADFEDIDISILPVSITKNSPIAIIAINDAWRNTFIMLFVVLKVLLTTLKIKTNATKRISIIQS